MITSKGATLLFDTLKICKSIVVLYIGWNEIDESCVESLGEFIKSCPTLKKLDLSGKFERTRNGNQINDNINGKLNDEFVKKLFPFIKGNKNLESIDFSNNEKITNESISYLVEIIETSNINDININKTSLSSSSIIHLMLVNSKSQNKPLKEINFQSK